MEVYWIVWRVYVYCIGIVEAIVNGGVLYSMEGVFIYCIGIVEFIVNDICVLDGMEGICSLLRYSGGYSEGWRSTG